MNDPDRAELDRLKRRLESLQHEFDLLRTQAGQLEARLTRPTVVEPARPTLPPHLKPVGPPPVPTRVPDAPLAAAATTLSRLPEPTISAGAPAAQTPLCPPPPVVQPATTKPASLEPARAPVAMVEQPTAPAAVTEPKGSIEMRLGTYWFVRVGAVLVLTAMVFFAQLAYQRFIVKMGPGGKVALLYLAGVTLLGLGAWLERRQEQLRNYARVLLAGGLAAVYFTTYAAHYVTNLRVIESPLVDGLLLLLWAGFMTWQADRRKSELLSLFAIGLAYYTSTITQVGLFTLYSNLLLTVAALVFLLRNRWAGLSFLSLIATYAGYVFWRFWHGGDWHWASPEEGLWAGVIFLAAYWAVFTGAVLASRAEAFAGPNRVLFLSLNNAAFFVLFLLTMLQVNTGGFWRFALIDGTVLVGCALLARRVLPAEPLAGNAYLTQGLVLVTVGIIAKFSGLQLALVLAAESVVLLPLGLQRKDRVLEAGAFTSAALAAATALVTLVDGPTGVLWLGAGVGALLGFNAVWLARHRAAPEGARVRPSVAYFTVLALAVWLLTTWREATPTVFPVALVLEAVLLTASIYAFRAPEVPLFAQAYPMIGLAAWVIAALQREPLPAAWQPVALIALTLGLIHWWQREGARRIGGEVSRVLQGLYALGVVGLLHFWLSARVSPGAWLGLSAVLALALTVYGGLTGAWLIAAAGQIFVAVSAWEFARQLWEGAPLWSLALVPIAVPLLLSALEVRWSGSRPQSQEGIGVGVALLSRAYRWLALVMVLAWVHEYVAARERFWVLALLGCLVFAWGGWRRNAEAWLSSGVLTAAGFAVFGLGLDGAPAVYLPNLLAIVLLLAQQRMARQQSERFSFRPEWHFAMIAVADLGLWHFLTQWVQEGPGGFYLTLSWAVLALVLLLAGMGLRERMHRWLGLGVLAAALGRVVVFDVWKLETVYRTVSFFALGVVLLVLGFIYNRYQEKIRQWL